MKLPLSLFAAVTLSSCATSRPAVDLRKPSSEVVSQSHVFWEKGAMGALPYEQRMALFVEADRETFKGCILYLEGLGDSIQNHYPLFNALNNAGFRVLAFDYLGQGGSEGDMAATRIDSSGDPFPKRTGYEIGTQAKWLWDKYSRAPDPLYGRSCAGSRRMVIGWSTGGLAAYKLAQEKWAEAVVLIAPGIIPNLCVGEAGHVKLPRCVERNITLEHVITQRTLTAATYGDAPDPHLDPVRPSGFLHIKEFAINLVSTAYVKARHWQISQGVSGLVFLSGPQDTYVDRDWTRSVLERNAPHFSVVAYDKALHEIDNEAPEISHDMRARTIQFFESLPPSAAVQSQ